MTTAINGNNAQNASATQAADASKSALGRSSLAKNFDTFLTMLTVQLKNQDPLSPMDSTQFTNQLVSFAGVEQQINANTNLEKLIGATSLNTRSQSIGYIGHVVEVDSDQVPLQGGNEAVTNKVALKGGTSTFGYTLDGDAATTTIQIKDENGNVLRTIVGKTGMGRHEYQWDGKDKNGSAVADGTYTVTATAATKDGKPVATTVSTMNRTEKAAFSYTLENEAATCEVVIRDSSGKLVRNLKASGTVGRHEMTWDGKDNNGKTMPDGAYTVSVAAADAQKKPLESAITTYGKVTDVAADANGTLLGMGKAVTTLEKILTVRDVSTLAGN